MARFRRRRYRRPKYRRRRYRRRRMSRRSYTVTYNTDYSLNSVSFIPSHGVEQGTAVGIPSGGFETWSVNPMPPGFIGGPGKAGAWTVTAASQVYRKIGVDTEAQPERVYGNTRTAYMRALTDLPVTMTNFMMYNNMNATAMWRMCDSYRIASVTLTFTIPELTNQGVNRHLFVEWTNLPRATASTPGEINAWVVDPSGITLDNGHVAGDPEDSNGWNWICNPVDVARACSIPGKQSARSGWNRAMLTATSPVTVMFRPRHAAIRFDNTQTYDVSNVADPNGIRIASVEQYANKRKLVRSYLPTRDSTVISASNDNYEHLWFGPCFRISDTDKPMQEGQTKGTLAQSFASDYNIRVNATIKLKLRGMPVNDPIFPNIAPIH